MESPAYSPGAGHDSLAGFGCSIRQATRQSGCCGQMQGNDGRNRRRRASPGPSSHSFAYSRDSFAAKECTGATPEARQDERVQRSEDPGPIPKSACAAIYAGAEFCEIALKSRGARLPTLLASLRTSSVSATGVRGGRDLERGRPSGWMLWRHRERQPSEPVEFRDDADRFPVRYHQKRFPGPVAQAVIRFHTTCGVAA